ncbi:MAG: DUF3592 domain-containing protein [Anaerolineae bacterium]
MRLLFPIIILTFVMVFAVEAVGSLLKQRLGFNPLHNTGRSGEIHMGGILVFALGAALAGLSVVGEATLAQIQQTRAQSAWVLTDATVDASPRTSSGIMLGYDFYTVRAPYTFNVGDTLYTNRRVAFWPYTDHSVFQAMVARLEPGAQIDILYDPANPDRSVVDASNEMEMETLWQTSALCIVPGVLLSAVMSVMIVQRASRLRS